MKLSINDFILWEVIRGNSIAADAQNRAQKHFEAHRNQTEAVAEKILQLPSDQVSTIDRIRAQVIVQHKQDRSERENAMCGVAAVIFLVVGIALWQLLFTPAAPAVAVQAPTAVASATASPLSHLQEETLAGTTLLVGDGVWYVKGWNYARVTAENTNTITLTWDNHGPETYTKDSLKELFATGQLEMDVRDHYPNEPHGWNAGRRYLH